MFICESMMSEVADRLGMSVDKFRAINLSYEGDRTHFNQVLADYHVPQMLKTVREEGNLDARREAVDAFNQRHRYKKRGIALIPTKFGISFTAIFLNQAGALVHIYHDGSILLSHGGTEMGQGLHTKMCMIAAQELNVPLESVYISETKTDSVANTSATAASASSDLNGMAVKNACEQLNARLQPYREKLGPKATMQELAHAAYFDRVNLSANGFYKTPVIGYTWNVDVDKQTPDFPGPMFYYFTQGVALSEVEIDTLTGDFTVLRSDLKMVYNSMWCFDFRMSVKLLMRQLTMDKLKEHLSKDKDCSLRKKVCGCKMDKSLLVVQALTRFRLHCMLFALLR